MKSGCLNPNAVKNVPIRDLESFGILTAFGFKINTRRVLVLFKSGITWSVNPFISKGFGHFSASFEEFQDLHTML